jgi:O-antigen ligase
MSAATSVIDAPARAYSRSMLKHEHQPGEHLQPNLLVRWVFYLSVFAIPFTRIYLPGTGERIGVARLIQALIICAVLSQPRVCIRFVPTALFWFVAYCVVRTLAGLWFTPELRAIWWPSTLGWLQFTLPWVWIMFNVLQFPKVGRGGLWALIWGCSFCALLHVAGIGVVDVDKGIEGRSTIFRENANVVGTAYAITIIVLVALGLFRDMKLSRRLVLLPLVAMVGAAMAKTGSRSAIVILMMGIGVLLLQGSAFGSKTKRLAAVLLMGGILAGVVWQIPTVMKRFEKLDASNLQQHEGRARMIPVLWEIFGRSPIYGSGPAGYQFELTRRAMPHMFREQMMISAHNLTLLLLVETGLIGFLLFFFGVKSALVAAWRARVKSCGSLPLALLLPLIIAGVILSDPSQHMVFWFAMAYALAGSG